VTSDELATGKRMAAAPRQPGCSSSPGTPVIFQTIELFQNLSEGSE
jgi:hypothetical protein